MDYSQFPQKIPKLKIEFSKKKKKIPMDLLNTPKKKKVPSLSRKENNDFSQLDDLYALDKENQSKSSISTNSFKHDDRFKKRVVHVLPLDTTDDSIVLIDPAVDLVNSPCNDQ